jgi:hypothetical protein
MQMGTGRKQHGHQLRARVEEVLAVVEHEQEAPCAQPLDERSNWRALICEMEVKGCPDMLGEQVGLTQITAIHEPASV